MAKRKKLTQAEVTEGLRHLAFGEVKDAVSLLFEEDETIIRLLPKLDLFNVSEIKRAKGGGMEIKFFDRLKALERLGEMAEISNVGGSASFFNALEKSAVKANDLYSEVKDE